ncbi:glycosyltransferase [Cellulomonas alba]|uniref:Glycosyltransferase n=1 Tax=Cellulomonas alba TaxID=3053467 RepID=A0ABT7SE08_9CELL|nr:glycosyltransferase [Cellulomonas alba]MDM7854409.1 glycosyltransferase [Cellulomonas alba]
MTPPPRVLGFGTYEADRHPRVRVLLDGLAARGYRVAECDVPLGLTTADRVAMLRRPWRLPLLGLRLARAWAALTARAVRLRGDRRPDVVLVGYLGHFDVLLARALFPRTTVVLDHLVFAADTAADRGVRGVRGRLLGALDRAALRSADVVVVDTDEHAALVPDALRARVVVVPVGASGEWFAAAEPGRPASPRLSVVFFGLMTPLQGAPVVARALRELGGAVDATVVGDGQDSAAVAEALAGVPRVRRLPWVEPAELPTLVAAHDVCLGVFGTGPKALRVVPNKAFQGAAAGCAVVTSDTPPQRRVLGDGAVLVPPGDAAALAETLRGLAADPARVADLRVAAVRAAEQFTAQAVTRALDVRLREALA